jgi:deoxycitidine kinase/deoxyguanosine kinase
MSNIHIISIEGNIGSGKSTFLENLRKYYSNNECVIFLKEPVDEWEKIKDENGVTMLEKFYLDQDKYSFSFQMMAYISRLKVLRETLKKINNNVAKNIYIITERSLYTDKMVFAKMLYESGKMEYINYQIYLNWFNTFSEEFPVHKVVYVKTLSNICYNRIVTRSRNGESNIPLEYLESCNNYHNIMLDKSSNECVCSNQLILDGNIDIYKNKQQLDIWMNDFNKFIIDECFNNNIFI